MTDEESGKGEEPRSCLSPFSFSGRDMIPVSIEERIICFADKFFSKDEEFLLKEKPLEKVRMGIAKFGQEQIKRFEEWVKLFGR